MQKVPTAKNNIPDGFVRLSAPIEKDSIVNGKGLRTILWLQGCKQQCPGCHNPEGWALDTGTLVSIADICEQLSKIKGQQGITFCGGEPILQAKACAEIARFVRKELGWDVWSFTGKIFEKLKEKGGEEWDFILELDALIDGPFILKERDLTIPFRGSRNQRILYLDRGKIKKIE